MLGSQRQVAFGKPAGGGAMQFAPARLQQRAIDAFAHQRMHEGKPAAVLAQELLVDQMFCLIGGIAQEMPQHRQRHPLAQDRCGLQCPFFSRRQAVGAAQHQALHRGRHGRRGHLAGMAQQLLEKERIAAGALHAGGNAFIAAAQQIGRQRRRFRRVQRRKVDGADGRRADLRAPAAVERIAFGPRT